MNDQARLDRWLERAVDDPDLIAELEAVKDDPSAVSAASTGTWSSAPAGCGGCWAPVPTG